LREVGVELCEGHHVHWLSRGGADSLSNLVLICPYRHRAIHRCDAPFDYAQTGFVFERKVELLDGLRHAVEA